MVAKGLVVSAQAQQVAHAQSEGSQQVALDGQPVAVPAGHLDDRLQAFLHHDCASGYAGHAYDGRLVVGDIDRLTIPLQHGGLFPDHIAIGILWRPKLGSDSEMAGPQHSLQVRAH